MAEMLLTIALAVVVILLLLAFAFLAYSGLFDKIDVSSGKPPIGQTVIAYKFARGPYKEAGNLFGEISKVSPIQRCFAIYYDDPNKVEGSKCRYIAGAILAEGNEKVDENLKKKFLDAGCRITTLPSVASSVKTQFSLRSWLSMYIAIFRVYPKLMNYVNEHRLKAYPYLEFYHDDVMEFVAPLVRQDEFFVEETSTDN